MPTIYNAVKEVPKTDEEAALNQEPVLSEPMNAKKGLVVAVSGSFDWWGDVFAGVLTFWDVLMNLNLCYAQ